MGLLKKKTKVEEIKYNSVTEIIENALAEIKAYEDARFQTSLEDAKRARIFSDEYSHNAAIYNNDLEQCIEAKKRLEATLRTIQKIETKREHDPNIKTR